jgi:hypothetical protein
VWPELQEQINIEIEQIDHLLDLFQPLIADMSQKQPDFVELSALATMLHSFYTGVENIFKRISIEIDEDLPSGAFWHSDLLANIAQAVEQRPAVISETIRTRLREYLSFRHVFRQAYSFVLDWRKMQHLVLSCRETWDSLKEELAIFFDTDLTRP